MDDPTDDEIAKAWSAIYKATRPAEAAYQAQGLPSLFDAFSAMTEPPSGNFEITYITHEPNTPRPEPPKTCRADACTAEVNPAFIFCTRHWAKVPKAMQTAIWQSYTPGQEYVTTPTPEHLDAVRSAVRIIAESEAPRLL